MLLDTLFVFTLLYSLQIISFTIAVVLARYPSARMYRPTVSVIIAARNEENVIGRCLESMVRLTYPHELLEVVVIDDRSTDATESVVRRFSRLNPKIRLIVAEPESGHLRGKTNAVTQGIEATKGEIILFTDADCTVPPQWVEETVKYYTDASIGIVAGFTALKGTNWFERMQSLDWLYLFSVAAAAIRLRFPVTAVGNNLSVRREAYAAVGGYRKIPFSVTEDYALFHAVTSAGRYRARFPLDASTLVESLACPSWRQLHDQKKRWFSGGRDMEAKSLLIFGISYVFNILLLFSFPTILAEGVWGPIVIKCVVDLFLLLPTAREFGRWRYLAAFPLFELYYFLYVLVYPPMVLAGRGIVWKERSFDG